MNETDITSMFDMSLEMGARGDTYPYLVLNVGDERYSLFDFLYNNDMQIHDTIIWCRDVVGIVLVLSTIVSIVKQIPSIIKDGYFKFSEGNDMYFADVQMNGGML